MYAGYLKNKEKELKELNNSEIQIKEKLRKPMQFNGKYNSYGIINYFWYQEYKKYLNDLLDGKINEPYKYNHKNIDVTVDEKIYCFDNEEHSFGFIHDFEVVSEHFINLLAENFHQYKQFDLGID